MNLKATYAWRVAPVSEICSAADAVNASLGVVLGSRGESEWPVTVALVIIPKFGARFLGDFLDATDKPAQLLSCPVAPQLGAMRPRPLAVPA
jgi:hypothetical protein